MWRYHSLPIIYKTAFQFVQTVQNETLCLPAYLHSVQSMHQRTTTETVVKHLVAGHMQMDADTIHGHTEKCMKRKRHI